MSTIERLRSFAVYFHKFSSIVPNLTLGILRHVRLPNLVIASSYKRNFLLPILTLCVGFGFVISVLFEFVSSGVCGNILSSILVDLRETRSRASFFTSESLLLVARWLVEWNGIGDDWESLGGILKLWRCFDRRKFERFVDDWAII